MRKREDVTHTRIRAKFLQGSPLQEPVAMRAGISAIVRVSADTVHLVAGDHAADQVAAMNSNTRARFRFFRP